MILDDWQQEILDYEGNILLASGRQIGKTQIFAIKASKEMLEKPGTRIVTVSLTEDQAKLVIVMILDYLQKNGHKKLIAKGAKKPTQNKIVLTNNSQVIARPLGTTGDALRGFTAEILFMDEVARYSNLILTAARPILATTGGKIWMASTFNAKQGFFWETFSKNPKDRFKIWLKTTEEVYNNRPISESWSAHKKAEALAFLEAEKATMTAAQYGQEYLAIPLDELRRYYDESLIQACCVLKRPTEKLPGRYFTGHDLARFGGDQFTAEVLRLKENGKIEQVESYARKFLSTVENEQEILRFDRIWNPSKIGLDVGSGTLGVSIWDHLSEIDGIKRRLVPMNNRAISLDREGKKMQRLQIEDFHDNLKGMMQRGEIKLLDDQELKDSFRSIQLDIEEATEEKKGLSKVRIWGKDSHHVEGLTRAAWLAREAKGSNIWIDYA